MSISGSRLLFRADGNATIGLGHVVRTLALADMLRGLAPGLFLVREPTPAVASLIATAGWEVLPLPAAPTLLDEAAWLAQQVLRPGDVVVVDGYHLTPDYQLALLAGGCRLVAIDDLRAWPVVADLVINHSPGVTPADYLAPATTEFLLGPAFSLLRCPFRAAAARPSPAPVAAGSSVLVCFGGADPQQLTARTLAALLSLPQVARVGVVVGSAFEHLPALQAAGNRAGAHQSVAIHQAVEAAELVRLLQTHAVVVAPASTVLIEALVLGRPVITGYYADNQRALADYVATHGQAFSVGNFAGLAPPALVEALRQGLHFFTTTVRQPYADGLRPEAIRAAVQRLLVT